MNFSSIENRHRIFVGIGITADEITYCIKQEQLSKPFTHFCPVLGHACSTRLFTMYPGDELVELSHPMFGNTIAAELVKLTPEARYHPQSDSAHRKGWLLHLVPHESNIALLARAHWVLPTTK